MTREKIMVLFTCFNRKDKTEKCLLSLEEGNKDCDFFFIAVDDKSTDGTPDMLRQLKTTMKITALNGSGTLFYSGGMRMAMQCAKEHLDGTDYVLLVNDDVEWNEHCIKKLIHQSQQQKDAVIVGATKDENNNLSYGAIKYTKGIKYRRLSIEEFGIEADTFNANCVLIPAKLFSGSPIMDDHYMHSLGDLDYGLTLKRSGAKIYSSNFYVGVCNTNSSKGTWTDRSMSRIQRMKAKESVKGAPTKQWFYFLKKNFGIIMAVRGVITPYLRILAGL